MDNRYYYRLLGLREDASPQQIKDAYENKIRKLKSEDYADDPEYVARKLGEVRHAYGVLTGHAAPATKAQKEAHFERWKDAMDSGEDAVEDVKKAFRRGVKSTRSAKNTKSTRSVKSTGRVKPLIIIIVVVLFFNVFLSIMVGGCNMITDSVQDFGNDLELSLEEEEISLETAERVEAIYAIAPEYDFEGMIDRASQEEYEDLVEWEISGDTYDQIWGGMTSLASALGLPSNSEAVTYITGDDDFYWEQDDLECALAIAGVMNPPDFTELAGCTNLYTDTLILNYSDYLWFLEAVAEEQTDVLIVQ